MPPGYHKEWHIGVRVVSSKKLVAFISGVPMTLHVRKKCVSYFFLSRHPHQCCVKHYYRNRNQLSLRTQTIAIQTLGTCAHQGSYPSNPSEGYFPGNIHRWRHHSDSSIYVQVCSILSSVPPTHFLVFEKGISTARSMYPNSWRSASALFLVI